MTNINKLVLAGRITRDPELRHTPSGMAVCQVGCAINKKRKRGDEWVEEAVFLEATLFGKRAEAFMKHHAKGGEFCFPDAELAFDQWVDKQTGQKRSKLHVHVNQWEFIGSGHSKPNPAPSADPLPVDDTPF